MSVPFDEGLEGGGGSGGGGGGGGVGGGDVGGGDYGIPGTIPGIGGFLRRRWRCNIAVTSKMKALDLINEALMFSSRMYMSQGANGQIRFQNKKPVDFGFGTAAFNATSSVLSVDDVSQWISDLTGHLLIDPHTNDSEVRNVIDADYPVAQNSTTLTTSHTGSAFTVVGFAGCDGDSTPATATITVVSFTAATTYTVTLAGTAVQITPSAADTTTSIAAFLAGYFRGHGSVNRRFSIVNVANVITFTARFGTLEVDNALTNTHVAPIANPTLSTTPTASAGAGLLAAGLYYVTYALRNEHGETLAAPYKSITIAALKNILVSAITPPAGCTVAWYMSPEAGSDKLRFHSETTGAAMTISSLPRLDDAEVPDLNRTGTEVMRVAMVFSDRADARSNTVRSNVIQATFEWSLADQKKRFNRIDLAYRDASRDWQRIELRLNDKPHQEKIKKIENEEYNGNAIDDYYQAIRLAKGLLAEARDSYFRYRWAATREALLLEVGDVVCITDNGSGVYNLPVFIEKNDLDADQAGMPMATFVGAAFSNTLWDDSTNERVIPIITENGVWVSDLSALTMLTDGTNALIDGSGNSISFVTGTATWPSATPASTMLTDGTNVLVDAGGNPLGF